MSKKPDGPLHHIKAMPMEEESRSGDRDRLATQEDSRVYQMQKSEKGWNQTKTLIRLVQESLQAEMDVKEFKRSTRVNRMCIGGEVMFDREEWKRVVNDRVASFEMLYTTYGAGVSRNEFMEVNPQLKADGLTSALLAKSCADALVDNVSENLMIDLLQFNGYTIEFNSQRYPKDKYIESLFKQCGEAMLSHVVKRIVDPFGTVVYLGKNSIYSIDGYVFCQGCLIENHYAIDGKLCVNTVDAGVVQVMIDDQPVVFKNQIGKVLSQDVLFGPIPRDRGTIGFFVQKKRFSTSSQ